MNYVNVVFCCLILHFVGSDAAESPDVVKTNCRPPLSIENGNWSITDNILRVQCNSGYKLYGGNDLTKCERGEWNSLIPKCAKICPPLISTSTTFVSCSSGPGDKGSCTDERIGLTFAEYSCALSYELPGKQRSLVCAGGIWNGPELTCEPVCGNKYPELIEIRNFSQNRPAFSWIIALYRKRGNEFVQFCGGTLISPRVIVTAAHCVDSVSGSNPDTKIFRVAGGKYYRALDDPRDADAQTAEVHEIIVPKNYKGATLNYAGDIALIVTKQAFNLSAFIEPVCVDWNSNTSVANLLGTEGVVSGWGRTISGKEPSEELKDISLPYIPFSKCQQDIPNDYKRYITNDSMCAGYKTKGIGVCEGQGGSGLVFRQPELDKYFLRGIVRLAPHKDGNCDLDEYSIHTNIAPYIDLISKAVIKYRI